MKLLVGLGNPGKKYERTRHNVGFLVVEEMAMLLNVKFKNKTSLESEIAESENLVFMKPQTFMNVSGRAVKTFLSKNKCSTSDLLVIYDDADIPFGDLRIKKNGSSGGHNGIQSIIDQFPNGTEITRLRVGIGRPSHTDIPLDAFVLQKWTDSEEKKLPEIIDQAIAKIKDHIK